MDNVKISNHQVFAIVSCHSCGTSIIIISASLAGLARQDAWISALVALVIGLFFVWGYIYLGDLYPGKNILDILYSVFGKWFGSIFSCAFVFFCLISVLQVIWYIGDFMKTQYMYETPIYVINLVTIAVLILALAYGIDTIARSFEIFVYIISALFIFTIIIVMTKIKIENLQPVLENGMIPVLKGSLLLTSYMNWPLIVINMLYTSKTEDNRNAKKFFFLGYLWGAFMIFLSSIMSILVLGPNISARSHYPVYLLAKEVNIGLVFSRMEAILAGVWILGMYTKCLIYFYAGITGIKQILKLPNYKRILLPASLILLVFSGIIYPDTIYEAKWDGSTWILFAATFGFVLPAVLLIITMIKKLTR